MAKNAPKYQDAAKLLRLRIAHGDYYASSLPGAPKLAQELGLSYITMRRAMQELLDAGDVVRAENGRLVVPGALHPPRLKVAHLAPATTPPGDKWRLALQHTAQEYNCMYQCITYTYGSDTAVFEVFDADFDIIFLQMADFSPLLLNKIMQHRDKVVTLFNDLTDQGIRCFDGLNIRAIGNLIGLLADHGYRRIDFVNCEAGVGRPRSRQVAWQEALEQYHCCGTAYDDRATPPMYSGIHAYGYIKDLLRQGAFRDTDAIFITSIASARGAIRALADHGLQVPRDLGIVSFGTPESARLNTPSITTVNTPELSPRCREIFEHYLGIRPQPERLMYRFELTDVPPAEIIFHGESIRKIVQ